MLFKLLIFGIFLNNYLNYKLKNVILHSNFKNYQLNKANMYAIVEIAGQQFKVEKGRFIYTNRLAGETNAELVFDKVLLVDNDGAVSIGTPLVSGASVKCTILEHLKGEKVIVFKKKRRKGYQKQNGHRQSLTKIQIEEIVA